MERNVYTSIDMELLLWEIVRAEDTEAENFRQLFYSEWRISSSVVIYVRMFNNA